MTAIAVVGHVEWVDFAVVGRLPQPGEILHAREHFAEPAGGGAVAAVQARRLEDDTLFLTAVGDDALGREAVTRLREHGVEVHAAVRTGRPQRRAFTYLDDHAERTITILGERLVPHGDDPLPWERLEQAQAVYFTGGDPEALRRARRASTLVATPRAAETIRAAGVELDVLVASATDPGERVDGIAAKHVVLTEGDAGGSWTAGASSGRWTAATPPGPPVDAYGCGDSFALGLTYALGQGDTLQAALEFGADCGAKCLAGRGPYGYAL